MEELTCTIAGTSRSTSFSYSGYHHSSPSDGDTPMPPLGSGFRLHPTKPNSVTHRSSSSMQFLGLTPGDCGSWHTPVSLSG